ncbi:hypothetical protein V7654_18790 [Bacillus sp. JJ1609]|uniref:hypothetical protein n=1 Tax=Bacillus sp. JJ1609 TaxID=3122977 RepID=UPI002FFDE9AB
MKFNISKILADISSDKLVAERVEVNVMDWFKSNFRKKVNEEHIPNVQLGKPIVMAEIRPGMYSVIDGNHRMERAYRDGVEIVEAFRLKGEQLLPYFSDSRGYETFVEYWNSKL